MEAIARRRHASLTLGGLFVLTMLLSACGGDRVEEPLPETAPETVPIPETLPEETVPET